MKKLFLLSLFLSAFIGKTQNIEYAYDDAGNRYQRKVVYLLHSMPIDSSGTQENVGGLAVSLMPNPTADRVAVTLTETNNDKVSNEPKAYTLILYDNLGNVVTSQQTSSTNTYIDLSGKANGTYILSIFNGSRKKEIRILKQ